MAKKSTTDTCCLTLPLILEKWQMDRLEKRFEIARQIYNTLVNYELKKLDKLKQTDEYKAVSDALHALEEQKDPGKEKKALFRQLDTLRQNAGFSEYGFKSDIQPFYKHFKDNIGSHVAVHGIAPQVWQAFDRVFHGNGKKVHFKKRGEVHSLRGYSDSKKAVVQKSSSAAAILSGKDYNSKSSWTKITNMKRPCLPTELNIAALSRKTERTRPAGTCN